MSKSRAGERKNERERKGRERRRRKASGDEQRQKTGSVRDMAKWQRGIFRGALEHKRVIVLAQMLLSHNKQDTMFLLS